MKQFNRVGLALILASSLLPMPLVNAEASLQLQAAGVNAETGEAYDCAQPLLLSIDGVQACAGVASMLAAIPMDEDVIGWRETKVGDKTITESCGFYRAQDGTIACELQFPGLRRVKTLWIIYCGCSDANYTTTGTIHNYGATTEWDYWAAFRNSQARGSGHEECHGAMHRTNRAAGATGGIQDSHWPESHCFSTRADVKGTWGVMVEYYKTAEDEGRQPSHVYVKGTVKGG